MGINKSLLRELDFFAKLFIFQIKINRLHRFVDISIHLSSTDDILFFIKILIISLNRKYSIFGFRIEKLN